MSSVNHSGVNTSSVSSSARWNWWPWPGYLLLFSMLFVPTAYKEIKVVLIALVLFLIIAGAFLQRKLALHRTVLWWTFVMAITGLVFLIIGMVNGALGSPRMGTVYVLDPLIYMMFVAGVAKLKVIDGVFKVLVFATLAISLYTLSYIFNAYGFLSDVFYIELDLDAAVGFYEGTVEYWLNSMSSLIFLIPFVFAALLTWPKDSTMPVRRLWLWLAFMFGMVIALLSGRRAMFLITALVPVIVLMLRSFQAPAHKLINRKILRRGLFISILLSFGAYVYLQFTFGLDFHALTDFFLLGFDPSLDEGAYVREEQFFVLLEEWSKRPFFGHGHGAAAWGSIRSFDQPWAYELSYVALLFHTGIVEIG